MTVELPSAVRPVFGFVVHVVIGAILFAVILAVATGLSYLVGFIGGLKSSSGLAVVPGDIIRAAHWVEQALFYLDLFLFGLFLLSEALKLIRGLWMEWRD